jgi:lysophospholipase L1-like esterase
MTAYVRYFAIRILLLVALVAAVSSNASAADFFFKDGDRVVIMGDSITEQLLYSNYVEMWTVSRFPKWNITFRNVGIGGDRSIGGNGRFKRDVIPYNATAMTVDFGMNDGGYRPFDEPGFKTYMTGLQGIADQAKAAGVRVAWATPSPVEKAEEGPALLGYNETLEKYSAGVQQIANANNGLFVDQFHPFIATLDAARAVNPKNRIGGGDPVHPGPPGQAIMAWGILKGLNFPTTVSSVEIDGAGNKLVSASNCSVSEVSGADGQLSFQRLDQALPFFPPEAQKILQWAPILNELNQYGLKVTGLKAGSYEIRLGGKKVAEHTAAELATGVNLAEGALAEGPVAEQVKKAWAAVQAKNKYFHDRIYRGIVLTQVQIPDFLDIKMTPAEIEAKKKSAIEERMAKLPEYEEAIRTALVIEPHRVEIVPVAK